MASTRGPDLEQLIEWPVGLEFQSHRGQILEAPEEARHDASSVDELADPLATAKTLSPFGVSVLVDRHRVHPTLRFLVTIWSRTVIYSAIRHIEKDPHTYASHDTAEHTTT